MARTHDANVAIQGRLAEIEANNDGVLTPAAVVRDAKKRDSPLHALFNWNVKEAAEKHWLRQARYIITSVRVKHQTKRTTVRSVFYLRDPLAEPKEQGYVSLRAVLSDDLLTRQSILNGFDRVLSDLARVRKLAELLEETDDIDELVTRVESVKQKFAKQRLSARRRRAANE